MRLRYSQYFKLLDTALIRELSRVQVFATQQGIDMLQTGAFETDCNSRAQKLIWLGLNKMIMWRWFIIVRWFAR